MSMSWLDSFRRRTLTEVELLKIANEKAAERVVTRNNLVLSEPQDKLFGKFFTSFIRRTGEKHPPYRTDL